jgi:hypothetical protein
MKGKREVDWNEYQWELEFWAELRARLHTGAQGTGATLTPGECEILMSRCSDPPQPKGRPPTVNQMWRGIGLAFACLRLENAGTPTKAAVEATALKFEVSRSAVYAARKAILSK